MPETAARPVTVVVPHPGAATVASAGLPIASAPGLLVVPWYTPRGPARGRFTLAHEVSGLCLVARHWCPHDVRRWAVAAGWIGVDWSAHTFSLLASGPARVFAWRLCDEWRRTCDECDPAVRGIADRDDSR